MTGPKPNHDYRLIVEGRDDKWSIINLTMKHGWDWDRPDPHCPYIDDATSDRQALEGLVVALRSYKRVGIVLDADIAADRRWQSICDRLKGFDLPPQPDPEGTVICSSDGKRLGVWLMPDNRSPGKLEDFLSCLVPPGDACWPWSAEATDEARARGARFTESDYIKARIHTWLAWQKEPGLPFGNAINAATLIHDSQEALKFVSWMERLFRS